MIKLLAAALLLQAGSGATNERCVSKEQFAHLVAALLPHAVESAEQQCRRHAGSTPFLASGAGRTLAERLRREAVPSQDAAAGALLRVSGMPLPRGATNSSMFEAMAPAMMSGIMPAFDAEHCRSVDDLASALAPVPSLNVGRMMAAIIELTPPEPGEGLPICRGA